MEFPASANYPWSWFTKHPHHIAEFMYKTAPRNPFSWSWSHGKTPNTHALHVFIANRRLYGTPLHPPLSTTSTVTSTFTILRLQLWLHRKLCWLCPSIRFTLTFTKQPRQMPSTKFPSPLIMSTSSIINWNANHRNHAYGLALALAFTFGTHITSLFT